MDSTPGYTEEPRLCDPKEGGCGAQIGVLVRLYGRPLGLRLPMTTPGRYHLVRGLNSVCEHCGRPIHFSVADQLLSQLVEEMRLARMQKPAQA